MLTVSKITFLMLGKGPILELIKALLQRKKLVFILLKQIQNISWVYIIMLIIVISLLMENK